MDRIRRQVLFIGHVQGVGFRYTAHNIAIHYDVRGHVRNLPDGRVEMVIEGAPAEVTSVVDNVRERMGQFIKTVHVNDAPATGEFTQFSIRN